MYAGKLLIGDLPTGAEVTLVTMFNSPLVLRSVFAEQLYTACREPARQR
jgi:hypothetical protein